MIINDAWDKKRGRTISVEGHLIASCKSKYQQIEIFQTKAFGKLLRIDGVIQMTEFDEQNYHEMISHVPFHSMEKVNNVLIVGGGDGGAAREILKHEEINKVDLVEIDIEVINLCKEFFSFSKKIYKHKKLNIINSDAFDFAEKSKNKYDLIIVDSTDPFSVGEKLFGETFFSNLFNLLNEKGVIVSQSESIFYDFEMIKNLQAIKKKYFKYVRYYYAMIPTYPSGMIGFSFCSNHYNGKSVRSMLECSNYYNEDVHESSFALPNKFQKLLEF